MFLCFAVANKFLSKLGFTEVEKSDNHFEMILLHVQLFLFRTGLGANDLSIITGSLFFILAFKNWKRLTC